MLARLLAGLAIAAIVVASASPAFAFGDGRSRSGGVAGAFNRSASSSATQCNGAACSSTSQSRLDAPEPLGALLVGLGLLGARYLRRR